MLSYVQLFATLWTVAHQIPLSMGFSRQEYWSGLLCPPQQDLPNPGIGPLSLTSPALAGGFFTTSATWGALICCNSVAKSCSTLCHSMDCSTLCFPVPHYLLEFSQTHVHWVDDAIQPSHPLSSPSLPTFNLSQYQDLFQRVSSSHQVVYSLSNFQICSLFYHWKFVPFDPLYPFLWLSLINNEFFGRRI